MKLEGTKSVKGGVVNLLFKALIKILNFTFKNLAQCILNHTHFFLTCREYDLNTVACTCKK